MKAIEELREKLDELGIEWDVIRRVGFSEHSAIYEADGIKWIALEDVTTGTVSITNYGRGLTPREAIMATCHAVVRYQDECN